MDVDAPPRFGAPGDPNPPEPVAPIGLSASLSPLSSKQSGKDSSIIWQHFIKLAGFDPNNPRSQCKYCKNQYKCHDKKNGTSGMLQDMKVCKKWHFPCDAK